MTNPDLERELEELLPCGLVPPCSQVRQAPCRICSARPAILAYVQCKLDEQRVGPTVPCDRCCWGDRCDKPSHYDRRACPYCSGAGRLTAAHHRDLRKLDETKADSELLAKVEAVLKECSDLTLFELQGDYFIDDPPTRITATTLREALRKLVEGES